MEVMDLVKMADKLAEVLREKNLSRISIKMEGFGVCVEDRPHILSPSAAPGIQAPVNVTVAETPEKSGNFVKSPIIGTFYAASAPDKPPFVKVGDKVQKGQVVCIVESMKLMNEITSEYAGTVLEIYTKDGETVEYDQKLMRIE